MATDWRKRAEEYANSRPKGGITAAYEAGVRAALEEARTGFELIEVELECELTPKKRVALALARTKAWLAAIRALAKEGE